MPRRATKPGFASGRDTIDDAYPVTLRSPPDDRGGMMQDRYRVQRLTAATSATTMVVLAAVGCTNTHHAAPPPLAPAAVATPAPTPTTSPLTCIASVTRKHPADGSKVGVTVSTAPGARITVVARFQSGNRKKTAHADSTGLRTFWLQVGSATPGYRVKVDVRASAHSHNRSCGTSFTPRQPPAPPAPSPAPTTAPAAAPAPPHHSGARCTATASVYDAAKDENNVYVHSNQPYTDATASADGDSWSYETNGSGYALIYLNGPPPGALITVTVGAATCTTSD
jgi:hypothetical protein